MASAVKWLQRWYQQRSAAPKPRGGSVSPLEEFAVEILDLIAQRPDLTLVETVAELRKRRIKTSRSSLWRFLDRTGLHSCDNALPQVTRIGLRHPSPHKRKINTQKNSLIFPSLLGNPTNSNKPGNCFSLWFLALAETVQRLWPVLVPTPASMPALAAPAAIAEDRR